MTASGMESWEALRVLTPDFCRPFSKDRNGMSLWAKALRYSSSSRRRPPRAGAPRPWRGLMGYGTSSDAADIVRPDAGGAARAIRLAFDDAEIGPGTSIMSTRTARGRLADDVTETAALRRGFGNRADLLPISSTKPIHGHALGAAGAIELVVTLLALRDEIAPPMINWRVADPKCDLDLRGRRCPAPTDAGRHVELVRIRRHQRRAGRRAGS